MGAALALAPILLGIYTFSCAEHSMVRNLLHSTVACVALVVVSLSWTMFYELTPVSDRPYVGSTTGNSMLELALLHNGANRFTARVRPDPPAQVAGQDAATDAATPAGARRQRARIFDDSPIGPLRLFRAEEAAQAAWWLPLALAGAFLGWWSAAATAAGSRRIMILSWCGWTAIYWLVFSFAGGVVHFYYLAVLGPPLAALAGIGVSELWHRCRKARWAAQSCRHWPRRRPFGRRISASDRLAPTRTAGSPGSALDRPRRRCSAASCCWPKPAWRTGELCGMPWASLAALRSWRCRPRAH
jgi:4-amino-4-deoxy-L-arabinose transferase-like glycosyltransferase